MPKKHPVMKSSKPEKSSENSKSPNEKNEESLEDFITRKFGEVGSPERRDFDQGYEDFKLGWILQEARAMWAEPGGSGPAGWDEQGVHLAGGERPEGPSVLDLAADCAGGVWGGVGNQDSVSGVRET